MIAFLVFISLLLNSTAIYGLLDRNNFKSDSAKVLLAINVSTAILTNILLIYKVFRQ